MNISFTIFFIAASCYLFEQIFYLFLGSYPYRYGININTIHLIDFDIDSIETGIDRPMKLSVKVRSDKKEAYIKYKSPLLVIEPRLFIGQIKQSGSKVFLNIKIGPISSLFVLCLVIFTVMSVINMTAPGNHVSDSAYSLLNLLCVAAFIGYLYYRFTEQVRRFILSYYK